jgi:hypothetical protein
MNFRPMYLDGVVATFQMPCHERAGLCLSGFDRVQGGESMKCSCDEIGESSCHEHGFGLLECDCGMRFTAPLHVKSFMLIQCPACGQSYVGHEDCCNGMWRKITEQERSGYKVPG